MMAKQVGPASSDSEKSGGLRGRASDREEMRTFHQGPGNKFPIDRPDTREHLSIEMPGDLFFRCVTGRVHTRFLEPPQICSKFPLR